MRLLRQAEARQERFENRDRTRARKLATRARIIVGGALMAEARTEPAFATTVRAVLERRVVDARDRHSIGLGRDRGLDRLLAVSQRSAMALGPPTPEPSNEGGPAMSREPDEHAEALDTDDRHDRFGHLLAEVGVLMREHGQA